VKNALAMGLMVGAGTDAHRVSNYNPFVSLRWFVKIRTIEGAEASARRSTRRVPRGCGCTP
jgi:predicted amidohydrolase YtcJ